jgi:hypothetical protein
MNLFSQEKSITIYGKIHSGDTLIANVHIYNITKKIGTISNDLGEFKLAVNTLDTLYISSLEYKKATLIITKNNVAAQFLNIELFPLVNELDEIFLRHLTGNLSVDIANKPKDTIPKHNFKFNKNDLDKNLPKDNYALGEPDAKFTVDPLGPIGGGATLPDARYQKELKLKREIAQKKGFPNEIKSDFGIEYFTKTLKIPEEKINHFLSYCEYQNIIEKYYNNKVLEVIEILNEESKNYNAIKD